MDRLFYRYTSKLKKATQEPLINSIQFLRVQKWTKRLRVKEEFIGSHCECLLQVILSFITALALVAFSCLNTFLKQIVVIQIRILISVQYQFRRITESYNLKRLFGCSFPSTVKKFILLFQKIIFSKTFLFLTSLIYQYRIGLYS